MPEFARASGAEGARPAEVPPCGLVFDLNLFVTKIVVGGAEGARPAEVPPCGLVFDLNLFVGLGIGGSEAMRAENTSVDGKHAVL